MARDEDDRQMHARLGELSVKVQSAQSGQTNVENEAARPVRDAVPHEIRRGAECLDPQAHGGEQICQRLAQGLVIIDDKDHCLRFAVAGHHAPPSLD